MKAKEAYKVVDEANDYIKNGYLITLDDEEEEFIVEHVVTKPVSGCVTRTRTTIGTIPTGINHYGDNAYKTIGDLVKEIKQRFPIIKRSRREIYVDSSLNIFFA